MAKQKEEKEVTGTKPGLEPLKEPQKKKFFTNRVNLVATDSAKYHKPGSKFTAHRLVADKLIESGQAKEA